jgi:hypothetical protein
VYIADGPGRPDPDFPDDVLLEIKLPEVIDGSPWELILPAEQRADYGEWVVPSLILNKHATLRLISNEEWNQIWAKYQAARSEQIAEIRRELVAQGLLEHARDDQGQPLYRKGQAVWRLTPKGREEDQWSL